MGFCNLAEQSLEHSFSRRKAEVSNLRFSVYWPLVPRKGFIWSKLVALWITERTLNTEQSSRYVFLWTQLISLTEIWFFLDVLRLYRYVLNIYPFWGFSLYCMVCIVIAFVKRFEICCRDFVEKCLFWGSPCKFFYLWLRETLL